ncbi:MAG: hypothetical protein OMM_13192, partial [Candidatus Magnetoglobus multicellularis str. Araruama]
MPLTDNKIFTACHPLSQAVLSQIFAHRADYEASLKKRDAAQTQLKKAQNNLKPKLDLQLEFGYSGIDDGSSIHHYFLLTADMLKAPVFTS